MTRGKLIRPVILGMALMLLFVFAGSTFIVKKNKDRYFFNEVASVLNHAQTTAYPRAYKHYIRAKNSTTGTTSSAPVLLNDYRYSQIKNTNGLTGMYSINDMELAFVYHDEMLNETFFSGNYMYGIYGITDVMIDMIDQFGTDRTEDIIRKDLASRAGLSIERYLDMDGYHEEKTVFTLDNERNLNGIVFEDYEWERVYLDNYDPRSPGYYTQFSDIVMIDDEFIGHAGQWGITQPDYSDGAFFAVKSITPSDRIYLTEDQTYSVATEAYKLYPFQWLDQDDDVLIRKWEHWMKNRFLQDTMAQVKKGSSPDNEVNDRYAIRSATVTVDNEVIGTVTLLAAYHPWIAAFKELKWFYLFGSLLTILCTYFISRSTIRSYEMQKETDEVQRSFTNAVAHELKTPLAAVKGYTENLLDTEDPVKKKEYLQDILKKSDRMDELVTEIIDMSKLDSTSFEMEYSECDAMKLIRDDLVYLEEETARRGLEMRFEGEDSFNMIGDEKYLSRMFRNILENAVSYAKEGSEIVIRTDKNSIEIFNESDPIPEDKLKEIFRFSSKKGNAKGHYGFGLYFAKKVADAHKLKLSVSNKNSGVSVKIER